LRQLPAMPPDPNLLIGAATADDAGVYRLDRDLALVQTADFFTPVVDDAFTFGQIAAANSLSDVYAMGGRPITALNLLGVPPDRVAPPVIAAILRGGLNKAKEARCTVVGGHTLRMAEPFYGMAVTGLVSPRRIIANSQARPGDLLVLTKPLGNGIVSTGIKLCITSSAMERKTTRIMRCLNAVGADSAEQCLVRAGTDITGFGLLGHLATICKSSGVGAQLNVAAVPVLGNEVFTLIQRDCVPGGTRQNLRAAEQLTDWGGITEPQKLVLTDAQTNGGLLLCVRPEKLEAVLKVLRAAHTPSTSVIGTILRSKPQIRVRAEV